MFKYYVRSIILYYVPVAIINIEKIVLICLYNYIIILYNQCLPFVPTYKNPINR